MKELTSSDYSFPSFIEGNCLYVDKTEYIWKLANFSKGLFFLSRPRRFGKSLTISTLKAFFEGRKELFKGLAIYDKPHDWKKYPVLHFNFGDTAIEQRNRNRAQSRNRPGFSENQRKDRAQNAASEKLKACHADTVRFRREIIDRQNVHRIHERTNQKKEISFWDSSFRNIQQIGSGKGGCCSAPQQSGGGGKRGRPPEP